MEGEAKGRCARLRHEPQPHRCRTRFHTAQPLITDHNIVSNAEEPGGEEYIAVAADTGQRLHEGLAGSILGELATPEPRLTVPVHTLDVALIQNSEGPSIRLRCGNQC